MNMTNLMTDILINKKYIYLGAIERYMDFKLACFSRTNLCDVCPN